MRAEVNRRRSMAGLLGATYQHTIPRTGLSANVPAESLHHVSGVPRERFEPVAITDAGNAGSDHVIEAALQRLRSP